MNDAIPDQPVNSNSTQRSSRRWLLPGVAAVSAIAVAGFFWQQTQANRAEVAAIASLKANRAILVMDANRRYAQSVNLSTVPPEQFDAAVDALAALRHAESVDLSRTSFNDGHLESLSKLSAVKSLVLTDTKVTDASTPNLASYFGKLESLVLVGTSVTSASAEDLSKLRSLKLLDASRTSLNQGFEHLAKLPNLEWLVLREVAIGAGDLTPLARSKSLQRLSLDDATLDEATAKALRDIEPEFGVDWP